MWYQLSWLIANSTSFLPHFTDSLKLWQIWYNRSLHASSRANLKNLVHFCNRKLLFNYCIRHKLALKFIHVLADTIKNVLMPQKIRSSCTKRSTNFDRSLFDALHKMFILVNFLAVPFRQQTVSSRILNLALIEIMASLSLSDQDFTFRALCCCRWFLDFGLSGSSTESSKASSSTLSPQYFKPCFHKHIESCCHYRKHLTSRQC